MNRSPPSSGMLPLPGSPGSSWTIYRARLQALFQGAESSVLVAFWLFGLINNVLYVIILSAALDLVGPDIPKSVVLLADVLPSFITKLLAPYFIHKIPYSIRILILCLLSSAGMLLIALTPATSAISTKLIGVMMASLSSGGGELSFLGLTHYYGHFSLAAWGSGTGGAGLAGAGLYVLLTTWIGFSVRNSLLASAFLPCIMLLSFFVILPRGPLQRAHTWKTYSHVPTRDTNDDDIDEAETLLSLQVSPASIAEAYTPSRSSSRSPPPSSDKATLLQHLTRARSLFIPYMLPLLLVYIAEYTINLGVSPTLLFNINLPSTPFSSYRSFYPIYAFLYQIGVFIARSSTPFIRIHNLYLPSLLQCVNLFLLISQSLYDWIPNVYLVWIIIFWEGLLGGAVYVNTFSEILENVDEKDREFSLGATSVSDSGGICIAGFVGMWLEGALCGSQLRRGKDWCTQL